MRAKPPITMPAIAPGDSPLPWPDGAAELVVVGVDVGDAPSAGIGCPGININLESLANSFWTLRETDEFFRAISIVSSRRHRTHRIDDSHHLVSNA